MYVTRVEKFTAHILDKSANSFSVSREHSIDWVNGYVFVPVFSTSGALLSIYAETDKSLRERINQKIFNT